MLKEKEGLKEQKKLEKRLQTKFNKALTDYHLIADGDKVLVALSGGKDSLFLLEMLARRSKIFVPRFTVEAVFVKMSNISYETDCGYLQQYAENHGVKLHIIETAFDASTDKRKTPCFLCSWYRRKAIFNLAQQLGCNKLALGHHNDDIIHTALMNLMFQGHLSSMPPMMRLDKMPITIIRPLCLIEECDIIQHAVHAQYQKQRKLCPYENTSKRTAAASLFSEMQKTNNEARYNIWHALGYDKPNA